ncbi:MAG: hypothetical protein KJ057_09065 [Phycisphaerae bacterium]|nr:MAG: hypothetical protein EDS66_14350 [Planctomycetota bacterium]MBE7456088.1 hypothetical protein [Planctomycetia bacterium]MCL4718608.1 hypothetical protein [Phycisphaerae bacterium]MCQ3921274.1 hypothetical protein [Planctomycetota bacterium]
MSEFFTFLSTLVVCSTLIFNVTLVLLALPPSKLREVGIECVKWGVVAGLVVLTFSPLDLLPGLPIDDLVYIIGAILTGKSAFGSREKRRLYDEIEMAELRQRAKGAGDVHSQN